ncbi:hemin receptor [bacterium]|nr:hemin receptor [bacterium]
MTPEQIELVQTSWAEVQPIAKQAAELFYGRLFEIAPETKDLFKSDMEEQGKKLMRMISLAVAALNDLEKFVPSVQQLGVRHVGYGVEDDQYEPVGAALLWTLGKGLGDKFTPEVEEAWTVTYTTLADVMKEAAAKGAAT